MIIKTHLTHSSLFSTLFYLIPKNATTRLAITIISTTLYISLSSLVSTRKSKLKQNKTKTKKKAKSKRANADSHYLIQLLQNQKLRGQARNTAQPSPVGSGLTRTYGQDSSDPHEITGRIKCLLLIKRVSCMTADKMTLYMVVYRLSTQETLPYSMLPRTGIKCPVSLPKTCHGCKILIPPSPLRR